MVVAVVKKLNTIRPNQRACDTLDAVKYLWWLMAVVLCLVDLVVSASSAGTDQSDSTPVSRTNVSSGSGDTHRLLIPVDKLKRQNQLVSSEAAQARVNSSWFQGEQAEPETVGQLADGRSIRLGDGFDSFWLRNGPFHTTHGAPEVVEALHQPVFDPRLHLILCLGPPGRCWRPVQGVRFIRGGVPDGRAMWADAEAGYLISAWGQEAAIIPFVVDVGDRGPDRKSEVTSDLDLIWASITRQAASFNSAHVFRTDASNFATHTVGSKQAGITDSSDGPPTDGRVKPDLVVPGADIQGPPSSEVGGFRADLSATPSFPEDQKKSFWSSGSNSVVAAIAGSATAGRPWLEILSNQATGNLIGSRVYLTHN